MSSRLRAAAGCCAFIVCAASMSIAAVPAEDLSQEGKDCSRLTETSFGPAPLDLLRRCGAATPTDASAATAEALFVDRGPILAQEAATSRMCTTSVAGIGTLTPFGTLATDFPTDVELLPGDLLNAYQLTTTGTASRMDATGAATALPNNAPPTGYSWTDMAVDPTTGTLYGCATNGTTSFLYTLNLVAGTSALVGTITNSPGTIGMAFNNAGNLYAYDVVNDSLISINKLTGAGTIVGPLGFNANFGQAMDCDPVTDICYLFALNATPTPARAELFTVNLTTGAATSVGLIGNVLPGGSPQVGGAVFGTIREDCTLDADCQDGTLCNGAETCVGGFCQPGTPVVCSDGLFCTLDVCAPATGLCSYPPNPCDDGDLCTEDTCDEITGCSSGTSTCRRVCNLAPIAVPSSGAATPYPSTITVGGAATVASVGSMELRGVGHTWPDDIDALLVGPLGQNAIVMSDVGGSVAVTNINLTLSDAAAASLPDAGPLVSGLFKPTNVGTGDVFPAPAPVASGNTALAVFNGLNPTGSWRLFVVDQFTGDSGSLAGGWCINLIVPCTSAAECDDGNPCTLDACGAAGRCTYTADNTAQCSDGSACTSDACVAGQCVTTPVNCDDGQFCTFDTCNPATGCVYAPNTCDDGDACTTDTCDNLGGCANDYACTQLCNIGGVVINAVGAGAPYPSAIAVSGLGPVALVGAVDLLGFSHTYPDDTDMLLVSPGGLTATILSDVGGGTDAVGLDLTLRDGAASLLPDAGPLVAGVFRPTNAEITDAFPAPAPVPSGAAALATFQGTNPNGTWNLYIADDITGDGGSLGGWCLSFLQLCLAPVPELGNSLRVNRSGGLTTVSWTDPSGPFNVYRGTFASGVPWAYNHTCHEAGVAGSSSNDAVDPGVGNGAYYLVTREDAVCGESIPGRDSTGAPTPNGSPCP